MFLVIRFSEVHGFPPKSSGEEFAEDVGLGAGEVFVVIIGVGVGDSAGVGIIELVALTEGAGVALGLLTGMP